MDIEKLKSKLGRIESPDDRDKLYLLQAIVPSAESVNMTDRYWNADGWWGNQGSTSECVGYAWAHWVEDGPVTQSGIPPIIHPNLIYKEAQKIDEWPGTNYDGTSVRAGVKVLQSKGFIKQYRWGFTLQDLIDTVMTTGPVVVGTRWHYDMFYPDYTGLIKATGTVVGGHAYVINGVNTITKLFRIKNSWGRKWGENGFAYISFDDMEKLINDGGEICFAIEIEKTTSTTTTTTKKSNVKKVVTKTSSTIQKMLEEAARLRELLTKK